MANSIRERTSSGSQPPDGSLASLHIFDRILIRPAGLIQFTQQKLQDAGICLGEQRFE